MKTFNEDLRLVDFDAWSGAKETKETILNANKEEAFEYLIEELYPDGLSDVQLNDLLWFESDWIYKQLGISEEEEEEEETE